MQEVAPITREFVFSKMGELYDYARSQGMKPTQFFVSQNVACLIQSSSGVLRPFMGTSVTFDSAEEFIRLSDDLGCVYASLPPHTPSSDGLEERNRGVGSTFESIKMMSDALALKSHTALTEQVGGTHYKDLAIQPAEYCQRNGLSYCESNVVKYVTRHKKKGGLEDIKKAIHNLRLVAHFEYGEELP